jgi:diguanylate cyclase (GGDEF)-like protein
VLTGLSNRRAFHHLAAALAADAGRHPLLAVVLDIDDFKQINDRYGHAAGDDVLITVARRFAAFADDDPVARLGGDEFAGLLGGDRFCAHHAASLLAETLDAPMRVAGHDIVVTTSVGVAPVRDRAGLAEALARADAAMYRAKSAGRDGRRVPPVEDDAGCRGGTRPSARRSCFAPGRPTHPASRTSRPLPAMLTKPVPPILFSTPVPPA